MEVFKGGLLQNAIWEFSEHLGFMCCHTAVKLLVNYVEILKNTKKTMHNGQAFRCISMLFSDCHNTAGVWPLLANKVAARCATQPYKKRSGLDWSPPSFRFQGCFPSYEHPQLWVHRLLKVFWLYFIANARCCCVDTLETHRYLSSLKWRVLKLNYIYRFQTHTHTHKVLLGENNAHIFFFFF